MLKKVLFWDFDGTLVVSFKWRNLLYASLKKFGYDIDIEEIRQHLRKGYTWHTPEISYIDHTGQKWWDKLFSHLDVFYENHIVAKKDVGKINPYFKSQILDCKNYELYDDAISVLSRCVEMGYKNYILSNNFPELELVIKDLGLSEYFADYIISGNIGYEKPRIEIFQYALNLAGFPEDCYMIGDNLTADIQGGKSAGMKTILVHKNRDFDSDSDSDFDSEADYTYENLSEIILLLDQ